MDLDALDGNVKGAGDDRRDRKRRYGRRSLLRMKRRDGER